MPGSPATTPNFALPRFADSDGATFSADINPIVDTIDSKGALNTDPRLSDQRVPQDGSVTTAKLADGAVTGQKVADRSVTGGKLGVGEVTTVEIQDGTITDSDLAANAVTTGKIAAGAVTTGGIADSAITIAKLAASAQQQTMFSTGDLKMSLAANPPPGWLLCDGSQISRITYAALFAILGTTYGAGDGSSTFNLPDLRGRALVGAGQGGGLSNRPLGSAGGEESHALSSAEGPSHAHGVNDPTHAHSINDPGHAHSISDPGHVHGFVGAGGPLFSSGGANNLTAGGNFAAHSNVSQTDLRGTGIGIYGAGTGIGISGAGTGVSIQAAGGNAPHNNMQPYTAVNYFIKS